MNADHDTQVNRVWAIRGLIGGSLVGAAFGYFTEESWQLPERSDWCVSLICWGLIGATVGLIIDVAYTLLKGKRVADTHWRVLAGILGGIVVMIVRDEIRYNEIRGLLTVIPGIIIGGITGVVWAFSQNRGDEMGKKSGSPAE